MSVAGSPALLLVSELPSATHVTTLFASALPARLVLLMCSRSALVRRSRMHRKSSGSRVPTSTRPCKKSMPRPAGAHIVLGGPPLDREEDQRRRRCTLYSKSIIETSYCRIYCRCSMCDVSEPCSSQKECRAAVDQAGRLQPTCGTPSMLACNVYVTMEHFARSIDLVEWSVKRTEGGTSQTPPSAARGTSRQS
jgi:hypothetical protein